MASIHLAPKIRSIINQIIFAEMKYSLSSHSYAFNRRSKEGDWICLKCANYNYSFRQLCNRCQQQDRDLNEHWLNLLGVVHYGELSFPSALFLTNENNLYYKNHHESQENPETLIQEPTPSPHNEYPLITSYRNTPRQKPKARTRVDPKAPQRKGGNRNVQRVCEQGVNYGKWINQLLD